MGYILPVLEPFQWLLVCVFLHTIQGVTINLEKPHSCMNPPKFSDLLVRSFSRFPRILRARHVKVGNWAFCEVAPIESLNTVESWITIVCFPPHAKRGTGKTTTSTRDMHQQIPNCPLVGWLSWCNGHNLANNGNREAKQQNGTLAEQVKSY